MRILSVLLLVSLPALAKPCVVEGLAKVTVPEGADCARFSVMFEAARDWLPELTHRTPEQVDRALRRVRVEVVESQTFACAQELGVDGCYEPGLRLVRVNVTAGPLLHEFLHVLESHLNTRHRGWKERGWERASEEFLQHATPLAHQGEAEQRSQL